LVELLPLGRAVDRAELLGLLHDVRGIDRDRPVDPLGRVPLLVLAALVEVEQPPPAVVVLPAEPGGPRGGHVPGAGRDRGGVVVVGAHGGLPVGRLLRHYPRVGKLSRYTSITRNPPGWSATAPSIVHRALVVGVPGGLELERGVLDVEVAAQAVLQPVEHARAA